MISATTFKLLLLTIPLPQCLFNFYWYYDILLHNDFWAQLGESLRLLRMMLTSGLVGTFLLNSFGLASASLDLCPCSLFSLFTCFVSFFSHLQPDGSVVFFLHDVVTSFEEMSDCVYRLGSSLMGTHSTQSCSHENFLLPSTGLSEIFAFFNCPTSHRELFFELNFALGRSTKKREKREKKGLRVKLVEGTSNGATTCVQQHHGGMLGITTSPRTSSKFLWWSVVVGTILLHIAKLNLNLEGDVSSEGFSASEHLDVAF
eukprot:Gb_02755 [translate_table: standard]